ncbi:MAG TPA: glycosyl hydrolase, partial [Pontiella sp.]
MMISVEKGYVVVLGIMMVLLSGCQLLTPLEFYRSQDSMKKGVGIALHGSSDVRPTLEALNVDWFYTWGAIPPEKIPKEVEFIPMIWGRWTANEEYLSKITPDKYSALLGFNEPDQHEQSNMSVEEALELWPKLMATGMRLGSPAGVHPDGEWMKRFMKEIDARGYRVDFITVHSYKGSSSRYFLWWLKKIHKMYNRPIWITEFAVGDWDAYDGRKNRHSPETIYKYMKQVLPALEKRDYIERYAWYSDIPSE